MVQILHQHKTFKPIPKQNLNPFEIIKKKKTNFSANPNHTDSFSINSAIRPILNPEIKQELWK